MINVEVYTVEGMATGVLDRPGTLQEALGADGEIRLESAAWKAHDDPALRSAGSLTVYSDDILLAVADDEPDDPIHAARHHVLLDAGPYLLEGELTTLPGFDPGRSLARPSGEFVLLRDVRVSLRDHPDAGVSIGDHALVNRYGVDRICAELLLGFFFPGARAECDNEAAVIA